MGSFFEAPHNFEISITTFFLHFALKKKQNRNERLQKIPRQRTIGQRIFCSLSSMKRKYLHFQVIVKNFNGKINI